MALFEFMGGSGMYRIPAVSNGSALRIQTASGPGGLQLISTSSIFASPMRLQTKNGVMSVQANCAFGARGDSLVAYSKANTTAKTVGPNGTIAELYATNGDPYINFNNIGSYNPNTYRYIDIRFLVTGGPQITNAVQIYFYNNLYNYATENQVVMQWFEGPADGVWRTLSVDMWQHVNWKNGGNITGWRYDWTVVAGTTMQVEYIRLRA